MTHARRHEPLRRRLVLVLVPTPWRERTARLHNRQRHDWRPASQVDPHAPPPSAAACGCRCARYRGRPNGISRHGVCNTLGRPLPCGRSVRVPRGDPEERRHHPRRMTQRRSPWQAIGRRRAMAGRRGNNAAHQAAKKRTDRAGPDWILAATLRTPCYLKRTSTLRSP